MPQGWDLGREVASTDVGYRQLQAQRDQGVSFRAVPNLADYGIIPDLFTKPVANQPGRFHYDAWCA